MKLTQNACRMRLPKTKSANARSELILTGLPSLTAAPVAGSTELMAACLASLEAVAGGRSTVCMRKEAVSTN